MIADTIHQKILTTSNRPANIPLRRFSRRHAGTAVEGLAARLRGKGAFVGLAVQHDSRGQTELLALATVEEVLFISMDKPSELLAYDKPFEDLLRGDLYTLVGFDMGRLVVRIANDLKLRVRGIDLSTAFRANTWGPPLPSDVVKSRLFQEANPALVDGMWIDEQGPREMCLRAWLAAWFVCLPITINIMLRECSVAANNEMALQSVVRLDTSFLFSCQVRLVVIYYRLIAGFLVALQITFLAELVRQARVLDGAKPKETPGEFTKSQLTLGGNLALQNARYKTRVRRSNQTVIMTNEKGQEFFGEARGCKGRTTTIHFTGHMLSGKLEKVRVFGPPPLTNAEKARNSLVLQILQGLEFLQTAKFIRIVWFPTKKTRALITLDAVSLPVMHFEGLNPSQEAVASKMVSDCPLVIAHGPPGTGKTTTIAAAVSVWEQERLPTWIIAHSNVAVKNMAETLFKKEVDFKILVSKEFHFEWHEHIYEGIDERVIVSDTFLAVKGHVGLSRLLGGSCIILSTLGMLSNPTLDQIGMFGVVPVERLVVDEASQIKIEDFLCVLYGFRASLQKLCFFGDPKQRMTLSLCNLLPTNDFFTTSVPPYGKDQVPEIKTIFDLPHLKETAGFLDTQYRMPVPLGEFISKYVYSGQLKSKHAIRDPSCISFVDTIKGSETKSGFSWTNHEEIRVMVNIVKTYYRHKNFCIITPYDAQRAAIERHLKDENLPWQRVFNVDSFQGNETDFVLVSVVRSGESPGFLSSQNRMNVLLTRCKQGLVVVTNRSFIERGGRYTLLGYLERQWMQIRGTNAWVDWRRISEGTADLPGAPGPNRDRPSVNSFTTAPVQRTSDDRLFVPRQPIRRLDLNALSSLVPLFHRPSASSSSLTSSGFISTPSSMMSIWAKGGQWTPSDAEHPASYYKTGDYHTEFPELPTAVVSTTTVHKRSLYHMGINQSKSAKKHTQEASSVHKPPTAAVFTTTVHKHSPYHTGIKQSKIANKHTPEASSVYKPAVRRLQISEQQIARARPERASSNTACSKRPNEKPDKKISSFRQRQVK
ncbi:hypothetical protein C0995_005922 [Termitomyces sp. Mi166|nr:hypothetical protein C0995_005922 [Termitomyces sp. Mi166\